MGGSGTTTPNGGDAGGVRRTESKQRAALANGSFEMMLHLMLIWGFGPFEQKLTKVQRGKSTRRLEVERFRQRELPRPPSYQGWRSAWRVLKTACLMLNIAFLAAVEVYGRHIEKLVTQWSSAWGSISDIPS